MKLCCICCAELQDTPPPEKCVAVTPGTKLKLFWCEPCQTTWNEEYLRGFWGGFAKLAIYNGQRKRLDPKAKLPMHPVAAAKLKARLDGYARVASFMAQEPDFEREDG